MEIEKQFVKAVKQGNAAAVGALVGARPTLVHVTDEEGATPLHYAAWKGHADVVKTLIDFGAEVNACSANTHYGGTPLHAAAHGNQKEIVSLLLEHGADRSVVSCNGRTPLQETAIHNATAAAKLLHGS